MAVSYTHLWTVSVGATAPKAAAVIHTDFEKGFIRAEVIAYDDFIQFKGENGAKEAGKWRLEGKDYIVQDLSLIHILIQVDMHQYVLAQLKPLHLLPDRKQSLQKRHL